MASLHLRRALAAVAIGVGLGRGAAVPDGCALADGRIEHTAVEAIYTCAIGERLASDEPRW